MRYIDADALKKDISEWCYVIGKPNLLGRDEVMIVIDGSITADVAPVRYGKWTTHRTEKHDGEWYCTECDYEPVVFTGSNFCPNCGAKMDLED